MFTGVQRGHSTSVSFVRERSFGPRTSTPMSETLVFNLPTIGEVMWNPANLHNTHRRVRTHMQNSIHNIQKQKIINIATQHAEEINSYSCTYARNEQISLKQIFECLLCMETATAEKRIPWYLGQIDLYAIQVIFNVLFAAQLAKIYCNTS